MIFITPVLNIYHNSAYDSTTPVPDLNIYIYLHYSTYLHQAKSSRSPNVHSSHKSVFVCLFSCASPFSRGSPLLVTAYLINNGQHSPECQQKLCRTDANNGRGAKPFRGKFAIVCAIAAHCKMLPYDALCYIP
jgi:hypothetical protein